MQPRDILIPLTVHLGFLPVIAGFIFLKKMNPTIKLFWVVLIYSLVTDLICYWFYVGFRLYVNNLHFINIYHMFESLALFYILNKWLSGGRYKAMVLGLTLLLIIAWFYAYQPWTSKIFEYSPFYFTVKGIMFTLLVIFVLYKYSEENEFMLQSVEFWILTGLFIQFFCPLMVNALGGKYMQNVWWINNVVSIITFIIYSMAFMRYTKHPDYAG